MQSINQSRTPDQKLIPTYDIILLLPKDLNRSFSRECSWKDIVWIQYRRIVPILNDRQHSLGDILRRVLDLLSSHGLNPALDDLSHRVASFSRSQCTRWRSRQGNCTSKQSSMTLTNITVCVVCEQDRIPSEHRNTSPSIRSDPQHL